MREADGHGKSRASARADCAPQEPGTTPSSTRYSSSFSRYASLCPSSFSFPVHVTYLRLSSCRHTPSSTARYITSTSAPPASSRSRPSSVTSSASSSTSASSATATLFARPALPAQSCVDLDPHRARKPRRVPARPRQEHVRREETMINHLGGRPSRSSISCGRSIAKIGERSEDHLLPVAIGPTTVPGG
jgi:hypothetical protein